MNLYEAVGNGIKFLDEDKPGWHDMIDLDNFFIDQNRQCILGQLYGAWHMKVDEYYLGWSWESGFSPEDSDDWIMLEAIWTNAILDRRKNV